MHQRELKKTFGPLACVIEYQGKVAKLTRQGPYFHFLDERTPPYREESFFCNPGYAAHGKVVSILTKWWNKEKERV